MPANAFTGLMHCADCGLLWSGSRWYRGGDGPPMERVEENGNMVLRDVPLVPRSLWCSGCFDRLVDEDGGIWCHKLALLPKDELHEHHDWLWGKAPRPCMAHGLRGIAQLCFTGGGIMHINPSRG